jgi:flagellar biosynthesis protein FlhA
LLGREEVKKLLDSLAKSAPKLVEDLVPNTLSIGVVLKVLQGLMIEGVPIRDLRTIAETLAENAARSQEPAVLIAAVRIRLGRAIVQEIYGTVNELPVITLDPALEQILQQSLQMAEDGAAGFEPGLADRLHKSLVETTRNQIASGQPAVLLVSDGLRMVLAQFVRHTVSDLHVLAFSEIPETKQIRIVANVGR